MLPFESKKIKKLIITHGKKNKNNSNKEINISNNLFNF